MAANLYARSIFGEDALANVSIEKPIQQGPEAPVTGHIRIRAKSQVTIGWFLFCFVLCFEIISEWNKKEEFISSLFLYVVFSVILVFYALDAYM